jgi:hypothetical protein
METSENPIVGKDQTICLEVRPFKVSMYKFVTSQNKLYRDRDSRAEQHICDCVLYPRWSSSNLQAISERPFVV